MRIGWFVLAALVAVLVTLPLWASLPAPAGALAIVEAEFTSPLGDTETVSLPHRWGRHAGPAADEAGIYRFGFTLEHAPAERLYLFVPILSKRLQIEVNGRDIFDSESRSLPWGASSGVPALVPLPLDGVSAGHNTVELRLNGGEVLRGHLSKIYLGSDAQLSPNYRVRVFLLEHLPLMMFASQLLLVLGIGILWLYRPREPLFGWLVVLLLASVFYHASALVNLAPGLRPIAPYLYICTSASGPALAGIALVVNGWRVPRALRWSVIGVPALFVLLALGPVSVQAVILIGCVPLVLLGLFAACVIAACGALRGQSESWLVLVPVAMLCWTGVRDLLMALGAIDAQVLLSGYYRSLMLLAIASMLMRRLALSLQRLDGANALLQRRLAEQEAELARLHHEERQEAAQRVREQERRRLTEDLHDGLSGHLVSILALAESERASSIEQAAREALDDLRLVIHSLDIGDRDLPLALAGFRERLQRQLKRLGVELDWSLARLPEISGVTPTHALNVLRILQEAITNALKHGPARRIVLRGAAGADGRPLLSVENDGLPFVARGGGAGLDNMRRRAQLLAAEIYFEPLPAGTRMVLVLPARLPGGKAADCGSGFSRTESIAEDLVPSG